MNSNHRQIPVYITRGTCVTPMGFTVDEHVNGIKIGETAIQKHFDEKLHAEEFYGAIIDKTKLEEAFNQLSYKGEFSTLEKMMLIAVEDIVKTYKPLFSERCGLIISSTKGNIEALEGNNHEAYYLHQLANKLAATIGINKEAIVLSNACVSGIMAISVAKRMIQIGTYDHFVIIGGDVFSKFVFSGFQSFQAVSSRPCKPYDEARDGITLGEAAAAVFVSKDESAIQEDIYYEVIGDSSINDANHISGPSRTGEGLYQSVSRAIAEAGIESSQIDSISAHGTATNYNDEMEAQAFNRIGLEATPLHSLKSYFGHTLGAAGLLETVISLAFADENKIPPSLGYKKHGLTLPLAINQTLLEKESNIILKTASGFGGSNTAVLFKKKKRNGK